MRHVDFQNSMGSRDGLGRRSCGLFSSLARAQLDLVDGCRRGSQQIAAACRWRAELCPRELFGSNVAKMHPNPHRSRGKIADLDRAVNRSTGPRYQTPRALASGHRT